MTGGFRTSPTDKVRRVTGQLAMAMFHAQRLIDLMHSYLVCCLVRGVEQANQWLCCMPDNPPFSCTDVRSVC